MDPDPENTSSRRGVVGGARLMRRPDHGIAPGNPADFVLVDAPSAVDALREISPTLGAWKRGRRSFIRPAPALHRP